MAGILAGIGVAESVAKVLAPVLGIAGVLAIGAGCAEYYERVAPWGVFPARDKWHATAVTNAANWRLMKTWGEGWQAADIASEARRIKEAQQSAADLQAADAAQSHASDDAFNQGVAFGLASSPTCGATHATVTVGGGDVVPGAQPGGLRYLGPDFAAEWNSGAYVPVPRLPG